MPLQIVAPTFAPGKVATKFGHQRPRGTEDYAQHLGKELCVTGARVHNCQFHSFPFVHFKKDEFLYYANWLFNSVLMSPSGSQACTVQIHSLHEFESPTFMTLHVRCLSKVAVEHCYLLESGRLRSSHFLCRCSRCLHSFHPDFCLNRPLSG